MKTARNNRLVASYIWYSTNSFLFNNAILNVISKKNFTKHKTYFLSVVDLCTDNVIEICTYMGQLHFLKIITRATDKIFSSIL